MTNNEKFFANIAIPPGETLLEVLESLNMTQKELSERISMSVKTINEIIKGKAPITAETALKLEIVLDCPASYWINLEANYQEALARIKAAQDIQNDYPILDSIPYVDMARNSWVPKTSKKDERVMNTRKFFNVALLTSIPTTITGAFKKSEGKTVSPYAVAAWLRKGQIDAEKIKCEKFNKKELKSLIPFFRTLTLKEPEEFYETLVEKCRQCGVSLVITPLIPKTSIDGATQWLNSEKVLIQLSIRGKRLDRFWFTFFHELVHILTHGKKEIHINFYEKENTIEDEADFLASEWIIPEKEYKKFTSQNMISKLSIINFAQSIGIHPCMIVGRLQHDEYIGYNQYTELIPKIS